MAFQLPELAYGYDDLSLILMAVPWKFIILYITNLHQ